jgi:cysteinyl-tRNA synthetase
VHTEERIARSLQDDLNTPLAIADIDALTKNMLDNLVSVSDEAAAKHFVEYIQTSLGIDISAPDITDDQKQLIAAREQARETKDWAKSDELRDTLLEQGIGLRDTPSGAIWYHQA